MALTKVPAVTGVALASAPTASFGRTLPLTVFGLLSSVMVLTSATATGFESVMVMPRLPALGTLLASVRVSGKLARTLALLLCTTGSKV